MGVGFALFTALVVAQCALPTVAQGKGVVKSVSSCEDLMEGLATESQESVLLVVSADIKCYESEWRGMVDIVSDVAVQGERRAHGAPFIDFGNVADVLHIKRGASLRLEGLILLHDSVRALGPLSKTPFIKGEAGSHFITARVLLNYRRCPRQLEPEPEGPTHHKTDRQRLSDPAGVHAPLARKQPSPHTFIKKSVTSEKGRHIVGCQTLVCCGGIFNRTVNSLAQKIFESGVNDDVCASGNKQGEPVTPASPVPVNQVGIFTPVPPQRDPDGLRDVGQEGEVRSSGELTPEPAGKKGHSSSAHIFVWTSIVLVTALVVVVGCVVIAYRRRSAERKSHIMSAAIVYHDNDRPRSLDVQMPNPSYAENIPQRILTKGKPPSYGGPTMNGMLTSWDMPQVGKIPVIRELPMSEVAASECDNACTPGRSDSSIVLQLSGLQVSMRRWLGNGSHSSVYEGIYKGMVCGMKFIEHSRAMLQMHSEAMEDYLTKDLVHPNIVKLLATRTCEVEMVSRWLNSLQHTVSPDGASSSSSDPLSLNLFNAALLPRFSRDDGPDTELNTVIVMEYCNGGSLSQALHGGRFFLGKKLNMPLVLLRAIDIAMGMEHLHAHCVVHGDLKPQNVLLHMTHQDSAGFVCKIVDFSIGQRLSPREMVDEMSLATMASMPPELLSSGLVSSATDVYSFGMILWGLVTGKVPFAGLKRAELVRHVVAGSRPTIPSGVPEAYARLIAECWRPEPGRRPDFRTITDKLRSIFKSTQSGGRPSRRPMDSDRRISDLAAKGYDSSDSESPRSVESPVVGFASEGTLKREAQCSSRCVSTADSIPEGVYGKRAVKFASVDGETMSDYPSSRQQQRGSVGSTRQAVPMSPHFPFSTLGSEYDGDCEDSNYQGRTLDSISTLATWNEQNSMQSSALSGAPKSRPAADMERGSSQYAGETYNGGMLGTSSGWSVVSSTGYSEDVVPYGEMGIDRVVAHRHRAEPIDNSRQAQDVSAVIPKDLSRTAWSNSDLATEEDVDRPSADIGRQPQMPHESLRVSDEYVVQLPVSSSRPQR